jgi:peptidoglycan/LPS O-acetylase OafA/YrhL
VELQFYLIVPLVVGLLRFLQQIHPFFSYLCLIYLQVLSFWRQFAGYTDVNNRHMMPDARFWQFLSGFLAFRLNAANFWGEFCNTQKLA